MADLCRQMCGCLFGNPVDAAIQDDQVPFVKDQISSQTAKEPRQPSILDKKKERMTSDFNKAGDDVVGISEDALAKLSRYQRFEKQFPFYRMDVNGYVLKIKEAMKIDQPEKNIEDISEVKLTSLMEAFKTHASWKDINNEDSTFVKFLNFACLATGEDKNVFGTQKLRVLGLLWCEGDAGEKAFELYENIQPSNTGNDKHSSTCEIACNDRDFQKTFPDLLDMATSVTFEAEQKFSTSGISAPCPYSDEVIKGKKTAEDGDDSKYDELNSEFLDTLFDTESKITRDAWVDGVKKNKELNYIFDPAKIRTKLGYE